MKRMIHEAGAGIEGRGARGFTLVELVMVVLVIGIAAMAIVPMVGSNIFSPRLRTAANILAADIEFCMSECIGEPGSPRAIEFNSGANKYSMIITTQAITMHSQAAKTIGVGETSMEVAQASGFPTTNFVVTVESEEMLCTSRSGNTLYVTRGYNGTSEAVHHKDVLVLARSAGVGAGNVINHPMDGKPYVNDFMTGRNAQLSGVTIASIVMGSGTISALTFDAYGRPVITADLLITLRYKGQSLVVTLKKGTGDVTITG